ncbi:N-acetyltransferase [Variovorax sp. KBW07]|uniref:GNAT family N-acetyltransferase n=1 Tax=Variovorax sp. KBW07 TaxID=2153358 RepID=UPI000F5796F8|nr:GNAT family N-acetyltransferase [Variovorax sp. KBW07]RQO54378.1 N-acetyltransferase [Variovorax sp. KBW07]
MPWQLQLHLRAARAEEAALLSDIALASKAHWPYPAAQLARWRNDLKVEPAQLDERYARVAEVSGEVSGEVAGFVVIVPPQRQADTNAEWLLDHLWVVPGHMGRGIGRALLMAARQLAAAQGASSLHIDADPYAEAFYQAFGAQRIGAIAAPIEGQPERQRPQLRLVTTD